jgi:hypothetical protein
MRGFAQAIRWTTKRSVDLSTIQLVDASHMAMLPTPWPRHQEVPAEALFSPEPDDLVVAVSHGWYVHARTLFLLRRAT